MARTMKMTATGGMAVTGQRAATYKFDLIRSGIHLPCGGKRILLPVATSEHLGVPRLIPFPYLAFAITQTSKPHAGRHDTAQRTAYLALSSEET